VLRLHVLESMKSMALSTNVTAVLQERPQRWYSSLPLGKKEQNQRESARHEDQQGHQQHIMFDHGFSSAPR